MHRRVLEACAIVTTMSVATSQVAADVVADWNEIARAQVVAARQLPPEQSRTMAMVHAAMFDAVNAIEQRYRPLLANPRPQPGAAPDVAAATAAHAVLVKLFPDAKGKLDETYAAALPQSKAGREQAAGSAVGKAVADAVFAARDADGTSAPNTYRHVVAKGVYAPTALPVSFDYATAKPWILDRPDLLRPPPPPLLTSPQWAQDFNEIKDFGGKLSKLRTPEQTDIARFWAATGVATWDPIVRQLATAENFELARECQAVRHGAHRGSGRVHRRVRRQVPLQVLAADYGDPQRRHR